MEPFSALQQVVKPDLEAAFGKGLASTILMGARSKSGAPLVGLNKEQFLSLINCICQDSRVKNLWGTTGITERLNKWKKTV